MPENRLKARNLDQDLRKEILTGKSTSASISVVEKPKYSSPDKTIKAAKAAVELFLYILLWSAYGGTVL
jgi:hypothetical protein